MASIVVGLFNAIGNKTRIETCCSRIELQFLALQGFGHLCHDVSKRAGFLMLVGTWSGYWTVERVCGCNIDHWQGQVTTTMGWARFQLPKDEAHSPGRCFFFKRNKFTNTGSLCTLEDVQADPMQLQVWWVTCLCLNTFERIQLQLARGYPLSILPVSTPIHQKVDPAFLSIKVKQLLV